MDRHIELEAKEFRQVNAKLDALNQASASSSARLDRILGPADQEGNSKELEASLVLLKQRINQKRKAEREEEKQAEKRRKAMEPFNIALQEGDSHQDGVVVRAGAERWLCDYQADSPSTSTV